MFGTKPPAQQHTHARGDHATYHQRSKNRPEQLPNPSQIQVQRHRQRNRGRAEQDAENLGALAVISVGKAAAHQHADHQHHRDQYRLKEDPAGFLERREHQLISAQRNADAKQRMVNHRIQGTLPIEDHWPSPRWAWRLIRRCISTPTKDMDSTNDNTSAPAMAQKSAAMSLA